MEPQRLEKMAEEQRNWGIKMSGFRLPRWDELPELDLYMDQVVVFLEKILAPLSEGEEQVTPAMINNYVKLRLIPKPEKKRYTRRHIAFLITITLLKQVLTISEIREGILSHTEQEGSGQRSYDGFCGELERAFQQVCGQIVSGKQSGELPEGTPAELVMVRMAAFSLVCKLAARKSLELRKNPNTPDPDADEARQNLKEPADGAESET